MVEKQVTKFFFKKSELVPAVLIISALVLLSTENLFHYPIAIMSALGIIEIFRKRICLQSMKYVYLVFFLVWLPMAVSSFLATNPIHSWKTTFAYLHFLPAAYYMVLTTSRGQVLEFGGCVRIRHTFFEEVTHRIIIREHLGIRWIEERVLCDP